MPHVKPLKEINNVAVVGSGVAGSIAAYLLSRFGLKVTVFERTRAYDYPCGEAVPSITTTINSDIDKYVVYKIRKLRIVAYIRGNRIENEIDFGRTVGYIIDKKRMVHDYRKMAQDYGARYVYENVLIDSVLKNDFDVVIDARGPFSDMPEYGSIAAVQGYTNDYVVPDDTIIMVFRDDILGYMWLFPSSYPAFRTNIGFGRFGRVTPYGTLFEMARDFDITSIVNVRGKKLKIANLSSNVEGNVIAIGEAGGYLVPFTGEGIRPAIMSATAISFALPSSEPHIAIAKVIKTLRSVFSKHHRIFKMVKFIGPGRAVKMLINVDRKDLEDLLSGNVSLIRLALRLL